jgi:hypothetical protein
MENTCFLFESFNKMAEQSYCSKNLNKPIAILSSRFYTVIDIIILSGVLNDVVQFLQ